MSTTSKTPAPPTGRLASTPESGSSLDGIDGPPAYPVRVEGRLDEPLSRGLWLVKWLLALPHWIVLAFLWIAVDVLTLVALVAILFTGRYPRPISTSTSGPALDLAGLSTPPALGTDRYPPFTLDAGRLPRRARRRPTRSGWLLAIPHSVVVAIFLGSWNATNTRRSGSTDEPARKEPHVHRRHHRLYRRLPVGS